MSNQTLSFQLPSSTTMPHSNAIDSYHHHRELTMMDSSMSPTIARDSLVLIKSHPSFDGDGIYAFEWRKKTQIRRINLQKHEAHIISDNPDFPSFCVLPEIISDLTIIGRVVGAVTNV